MKVYFYQEGSSCIDNGLTQELEKHIKIELIEAPSKLNDALKSWGTESDLNSVVLDAIDDEDCRILVICEKQSKFHDWCINQCDHANWGCSNSYISVDYSPNHRRLYNQLHECLHFLGVGDCYQETSPDKAAKTTCDNTLCVMRFGSPSTEICSSVLNQLCEWSSK